MVHVQIEVDPSDVRRWVSGLVHEQVPFAASRALNSLADHARKTMLDRIGRQFTIRRATLLDDRRGVLRVRPSKKSQWPELEAEVGVARWAPWLVRHEKGGTFGPRPGARSVPVPTRVAASKRTRTGRIPRSAYVRALLERKGGRVADLPGNDIVLAPLRRGRQLLAWYTLASRIRLRPTLGYEQTIREDVAGRWASTFRHELRAAVRTARR